MIEITSQNSSKTTATFTCLQRRRKCTKCDPKDYHLRTIRAQTCPTLRCSSNGTQDLCHESRGWKISIGGRRQGKEQRKQISFLLMERDQPGQGSRSEAAVHPRTSSAASVPLREIAWRKRLLVVRVRVMLDLVFFSSPYALDSI